MIHAEDGMVRHEGKEYTAEIVNQKIGGGFPPSKAELQEDESLIGKPQETCWG